MRRNKKERVGIRLAVSLVAECTCFEAVLVQCFIRIQARGEEGGDVEGEAVYGVDSRWFQSNFWVVWRMRKRLRGDWCHQSTCCYMVDLYICLESILETFKY